MNALDSLRRVAAEQSRARLPAIGALASLVWLALVALFAWLDPREASDGLTGWLVWILGAALPLGLIWFAIWSARSLALLRQEAEDLRASLREIRSGTSPAHEPRLAPRSKMASLPASASRPRPANDMRQAPLDLGGEAAPELTPDELFFALNFPDGPDDREAIRCLRLALADPGLARLIRAAQDVVTLLAGQGVYMDDLDIPATLPLLWQRLAEGKRGPDLAGLAVIEDRDATAKTAAMMQTDPVFRDVAHHFLRHFDRLLSRRAETDPPELLAIMSESRSGRAFLLLGQVSGLFGRAGQEPG
ncbi:hypothetical protein [Paracoccus ravus]|uniref:hypothetical protein n=1 Tax=Paracoccus ravus TaxID=2447760 RepID=UPI00106E56A7|nr:hypothetical protein [Paracoccus ravus]